MASTGSNLWRIAHSECSLGWGGQEQRVLAELAGFHSRGSAVSLLAPRTSRVYERAQQAGLPVEHLSFGKLSFPFDVVRAAGWLRGRRINVLNTHSSRDGWVAGLAGRLARVPLILRTRHIDVDYPNRWLSRHAFTTLADHVLTTSEKITEHFHSYFDLPSGRVSTIPTGIDLKRFAPEGPAAELIPGVSRATVPVIGMVSVLRSWKGHAVFLEATRLLIDGGLKARFVIVGEGPVRLKIEQQIRELKLDNSVLLLGHREDVPEVLRALSVLAIPSTKHEGVPQIGLQALATKTPVVGSDVGGIPEIIQPGVTGWLFPSGQAPALATAIRQALDTPTVTAAMCERGRKNVEAKHSLETMLDQLDALYRRYLAA